MPQSIRPAATLRAIQLQIGIVALARKLIIALWKYLERGEIPAGARLVDWRSKLIRHKVNKPAA